MLLWTGRGRSPLERCIPLGGSSAGAAGCMWVQTPQGRRALILLPGGAWVLVSALPLSGSWASHFALSLPQSPPSGKQGWSCLAQAITLVPLKQGVPGFG